MLTTRCLVKQMQGIVNVLGLYAWWVFALLTFALFLGAATSLLHLDSKDGWPNLIFCSVAACIVSGFMRLTEEIPLAGAAILVLLVAHIVIRRLYAGLNDEDRK